MRATRASISSRRAGPRAAKGSSSSRSGRRRRSARASATRPACPPESAAGLRAPSPSSPTSARAAATCRRSGSPSRRSGRRPNPTFWLTVRCGKRLLS
ncbi:hypothetical protein CG51_09795 [Haematobacter missouriensis]|nr:hypothetical protein CG51_09795 [Haematobacter missouriensis]